MEIFDKTGEGFFYWKRVEAKESNLLLVVVSTLQTLFHNVKNGVLSKCIVI